MDTFRRFEEVEDDTLDDDCFDEVRDDAGRENAELDDVRGTEDVRTLDWEIEDDASDVSPFPVPTPTHFAGSDTQEPALPHGKDKKRNVFTPCFHTHREPFVWHRTFDNPAHSSHRGGTEADELDTTTDDVDELDDEYP